MPFPGNRHTKLLRPIREEHITGTLSHDLIVVFRRDAFPDAALTLGGEGAIQQGGLDLAFSSDSAGENRLAAEVVDFTISAVPANASVQIYVRVPNVSDTLATPIYIWYGDETESLPLATEDYGRNDVWNGFTGSSAPIVTWGVWHFEEAPSSPVPQFVDSSGNGHTASTSQAVNACEGPLGGACLDWQPLVTTANFTPGTGDYGHFQALMLRNGETDPYSTEEDAHGAFGWVWRPPGEVTVSLNGNWATLNTNDGVGVCCSGGARSGGDSWMVANHLDTSRTGETPNSISLSPFEFKPGWGHSAAARALFILFSCAPNVHWLRALAANIRQADFFDTSFAPEAASITAEIAFDGLNEGSEVRIYEEPHPQVWTLDFTGATYADILGEYAAFSIQGESTTSDHYVYWGTDPALSGRTGHAVALASGDGAVAIATKTTTVLAAITDLDATRDATVITVACERNGECAAPSYTGTEGVVRLVQVGGASMAEITGIESSAGTSWTGAYSILRPRRAVIQIMHRLFKFKRYSTILQTAGLSVPAGALQVEDANYTNPS